MRQGENRVTIEGILAEIDIKESSFFKKKTGKEEPSISGSIIVRVEQMINGENKVLDIPVHMFAAKNKNDGNPNPAYASILGVKNEFNSIAAVGVDAADRVRITGASLSMNEYYGRNGQLISYPRIQTSFVNKVNKDEFKPEAKFEVEIAIGANRPETDAEGVETGRQMISGIISQYGGKVDVMNFFVANPQGIAVIAQEWTVGSTVKAIGKLNFSTNIEVVTESAGWGEPIEKTKTTRVSELIVTGGSEMPLEPEFAFPHDEIQAALKARTARLDAMKDNQNSKPSTPAHSVPEKDGFDNLGF